MTSREVIFEYNIKKNKAEREKATLKEDVKTKVDAMGLKSADRESLKTILDDIMEKLV